MSCSHSTDADKHYTIGEAASLSGISAKMIRHYESLGLITPSERSAGNYRLYQAREIHQLTFIRNARALGFAIKDIAALLDLWRNNQRSSAAVKKIALTQLQDIDERIATLQQMRALLQNLTEHCQGDQRPDCPILEGLACKQL